MDKFYLTTAIDYVNGAPHIGHAYEKILTDIIARHFSQRTNNLFFLTGTDEHGIKIQKTSAAQGKTPKQLCDENAQKKWLFHVAVLYRRSCRRRIKSCKNAAGANGGWINHGAFFL